MRKRKFAAAVAILIVFTVCIQFDSVHAESPEPRTHFYFIQITDTHWGKGDNLKRFGKAVEIINALPMPLTCLIHTGDITNRNITDASVVKSGFDLFDNLAIPVHFVPGNQDILPYRHDATKKAYNKYFGDFITEREYHGVVFIMVYTEPLARSFSIKGYQPLVELKAALERANKKPVIIFHHAPSVEDFYNNKMHKGWEAKMRKSWSSLLNAYNVKAIIAGHFHRDEHHWVGNIPLYVSPAISEAWGRQATFRIYEYRDGKIGYRTQYIK